MNLSAMTRELRLSQRLPAVSLVPPCKIAWSARASARPARSSRGGRRSCLRVHAIGFDLTGDAPTRSVERRAEELANAAASLLLFKPVIDNAPAKAFLKVLASLQRKSLPDVLVAYGEFYSEMAASKSASWQDFLLDELLSGRSNAWAKAAANKEANPRLLPAVEHDLDALQKLAVGERTLTDWVREAHPGVPSAWLAAASGPGPAAVESDWPEQLPAPGELLAQWGMDPLPDGQEAADVIQGPPSLEQLKAWRARIANEWQWSNAAPQLQAFFARHGHGLTQRYSVLEYRGGALQAFVPFQPGSGWLGYSAASTSDLQWLAKGGPNAREVLSEAQAHLSCRGEPDRALYVAAETKADVWHTLVTVPNLASFLAVLVLMGCMPPERADRDSHWEVLGRSGLRTVLCPLGGGAEQVAGLARALAQYRRVRFLVVPLLDQPAKAGLQDFGWAPAALPLEVRGVWPANALLTKAQFAKG